MTFDARVRGVAIRLNPIVAISLIPEHRRALDEEAHRIYPIGALFARTSTNETFVRLEDLVHVIGWDEAEQYIDVDRFLKRVVALEDQKESVDVRS